MMWWANGGEQTLDSYGVNDPDAIPADHIAWIKALPADVQRFKRLYVHAGIRPGIPLPCSIRKGSAVDPRVVPVFRADHGVFVVHGHTPTKYAASGAAPETGLDLDTARVLAAR
jgi:serine/threonine protein phosphatase 1